MQRILTFTRRHIKDFHSQASTLHQCVRCKRSFSALEELNDHLRQPNPCQVREAEDNCGDPEDGIMPEMAEMLADRRGSSKIDTWDKIWGVIFPRDRNDEIPSPSKYFITIPHITNT